MPVLALCRFEESGNLLRQEVDILATPYITISHVWCNASWCNIPGVSWKVLASPQKARWIREELPTLVGQHLFWMDILAVDQSSSAARVAVVEAIPALYKHAMKTILVREDGGFGECCVDFIPKYDDEEQGNLTVQEIKETNDHASRHMEEHHHGGLREIWLERMWPLQELMLFHTIQVTICKSVSPEPSPIEELNLALSKDPKGKLHRSADA
jgi:hypothetical protein